MSHLFQHAAFPMFALCASYLVVVMLAIGHITGITRMKGGLASNTEDFDAFRLEPGDVTATNPVVSRYERLHRNHLESTLPFLAIGMVYLATNPGSGLASGLFVAFAIFRTVFTVCYINAMQPWRSATFMFGEICLLVMVAQTAWFGLTHL